VETYEDGNRQTRVILRSEYFCTRRWIWLHIAGIS